MSKRRRSEELLPSTTSATVPTIVCTLGYCVQAPPEFSSYPEYELHVQTHHTHICHACKKRFPSAPILSMHIEEKHDPFFVIKRDQGLKVYKCFKSYNEINPCHKVCSDRKKRRLHMIDKHGYPRDYNFSIIDRGL
ncbi:hypothetical protein CANTEDRAFT_108530 [Yamadazyma tenuis ATCC 10573]|uniref:C2H2-type domain-containing protein n=1 Tax=Candida tenuis (strain ATCC 10573 / BCRC 21748 / CBS 615 / JCM 9827 / NBRC 10315 / NRRL Y-1498 / VKM Y-70) TaxID=590646 RepID=G3BBK6_CANTC|nr:uncharacterized protein CANTEDRAFT_108530 [Yamadazyma tenuis ATCC 10573]EGV61562.1 hypothetical protein CANTEDRAFT_108530 [Yamadazyma tenuis ATCC 10573]